MKVRGSEDDDEAKMKKLFKQYDGENDIFHAILQDFSTEIVNSMKTES